MTDNAIINSKIPANLTEIFSSDTLDDGNTLSGAFDIQYRPWSVDASQGKQIDAGRSYSKGSYRALDTLILHRKTEAVDGLLVDTVHGGVGFRNHTVPRCLQYGAKWSEDLTWLEPVTACVDTNLSFRFHLSDEDTNITRITLVDEGGFTNLARDYPYGFWNDSQDPDLQARAYKCVWLNNAYTAVFYNMTYSGHKGPWNTSEGTEFSLGDVNSFGAYKPALNSIKLSAIDGGYLNLGSSDTNLTTLSLSSPVQARVSISRSNFSDAQISCQGWGEGDVANITNTLISCGYLYGAPRRLDGVESLIFEPNSVWTQNLYVCATGVRSSIKKVDFSINGTASLSNLNIVGVDDKFITTIALDPYGELSRPLRISVRFSLSGV